MSNIKFDYGLRNSVKVDLKMPVSEIELFEMNWKKIIDKKYGTSLVLPVVRAVVSEDGTTITDSHLIVDGILKY